MRDGQRSCTLHEGMLTELRLIRNLRFGPNVHASYPYPDIDTTNLPPEQELPKLCSFYCDNDQCEVIVEVSVAEAGHLFLNCGEQFAGVHF